MRSMRGMLGMTMMMASLAAMGESMNNVDVRSGGTHIHQKTILTKKQKKNRNKSKNGRKAKRNQR